ncbi:MAG: response regulator [Planctomycetes bacterium]|nr:response regulator [Planctomycetota bacterium]
MARVLIVDDEAPIRRVLRLKLEQCAFEVEEAGDGDQAIEQIDHAEFDLVVADIVMPNRDGLEVIMHLRKKAPGVKVIAISAPGNELYLDVARSLGADHVFTKPFELADLARVARDLVGARG